VEAILVWQMMRYVLVRHSGVARCRQCRILTMLFSLQLIRTKRYIHPRLHKAIEGYSGHKLHAGRHSPLNDPVRTQVRL
jgi:hypothetical protein